MATKLGDITEYFSPGLTLTVRGGEYTVPLPSAELGLWLRTTASMAGELAEDASDEDFARMAEKLKQLPDVPDQSLSGEEMLLGAAYHQMAADGVPDPYIQFCAQAAYIWILQGEERVAAYWAAGGRPEAMGPSNRKERRARQRAGATSTAAANATPSPASTSGTSTPPQSSGSGKRRRRRR